MYDKMIKLHPKNTKHYIDKGLIMVVYIKAKAFEKMEKLY